MADWGNLQVQFSGPAASVISELREEIRKAGFQQIFLVGTVSQLRERSLLQDRLIAAIGTVYVGLVLVLVVVGLLGLLLFFVASREKEIAIRVALGAEQYEIKKLVGREAALLITTGILIGLPASFAVVHTCSSLLYGIPATLIGPLSSAVVALSTVGIFAILIPMYRAARIAPSALLRDS